MKYYVDIIYIMIVNGVIISNDRNKNLLEKFIKASGLSNVKKGLGLSNVKSVKGAGLKILK